MVTTRPKTEPSEAAEHARYFHTRDPVLRDRLIERYQPLAAKVASRYSRSAQDRDDLRQVALVGVMNALERFDPTRGVKFTTFAWVTASGELKRYRRGSAWSLHVPRALQERYLEVAAAADDLPAEIGREASAADVADRIGESEDDVRECLDIRSSHPTSLERCLWQSNDAPTPACAPACLDQTDVIDDRDALRRALTQLGSLERDVVVLHYLEGMTQTDVAKRVGASQTRVSRALTRGVDRLRALLAPAPAASLNS
jgi:RNA polymerase sigma-B factor